MYLTISIIDDRVLDGYISATVGVPAIGVLSQICILAGSRDIYVVEDNVACVGDKMVVLW